MPLQDPVADVDDVNILFHNDVAGKRAVVHPVSEPQLNRRGIRSRRAVEITSQIVRLAANDRTQGAVVNTLHHFYERRAIADLEANIQAELALGALTDLDYFLSAGHIHRDRLFEIDVLPASHNGFEVPWVKIRGCCNYDCIHLL